jgi:tRNA threonylcarbamoyladenosine biosynthesis protein TsaB
MIKLIIDTSSHICQIALIRDEELISHVFQERSFGMGEIIFEIIAQALNKAAIIKRDICEIYVTLGPGSFTGVRIGIATALGLKLGFGIPLLGVSSFKAHAQRQKLSGLKPLVVLDARRQDIYVQAFDVHLNPETDPLNISLETFREMFSRGEYFVCGDGITQIRDRTFLYSVFDQNRFLDPLLITQTPCEDSVVPLYVRPPDVGIKKLEK